MPGLQKAACFFRWQLAIEAPLHEMPSAHTHTNDRLSERDSRLQLAIIRASAGTLTKRATQPYSGLIRSQCFAPLRVGACPVIRTVALGVVCLAGLCAIAAAAKRS